ITAEAEISKQTKAFITNQERLDMLKERYGSGQASWNNKLRIVATSIEDINRKVFDETSNVDIYTALQASAALQGVWPSVEIN
ncbi:patatin-like phospholipase family protein, partial [Streptococcus thermophilus]|nr:patatin-like phospholipase family protein [Streptococcus thermophilus]